LTTRIQTGSYTNRDGQEVYTTDIVAEEQEFAESKIATGNGGQSQDNYSRQVATADAEEFKNILDGIDYEFPFL
jgi:single-strand DNA-binding protein